MDLDGAPMIALLAMVVDPENKATTPINPNQPPINHQSMSEKKEIQGTPTTFPNINNTTTTTTYQLSQRWRFGQKQCCPIHFSPQCCLLKKQSRKVSRKESRKESGGLNYVQQRTANIGALPVLPELKATCNVPVASGTGMKKKKKKE